MYSSSPASVPYLLVAVPSPQLGQLKLSPVTVKCPLGVQIISQPSDTCPGIVKDETVRPEMIMETVAQRGRYLLAGHLESVVELRSGPLARRPALLLSLPPGIVPWQGERWTPVL